MQRSDLPQGECTCFSQPTTANQCNFEFLLRVQLGHNYFTILKKPLPSLQSISKSKHVPEQQKLTIFFPSLINTSFLFLIERPDFLTQVLKSLVGFFPLTQQLLSLIKSLIENKALFVNTNLGSLQVCQRHFNMDQIMNITNYGSNVWQQRIRLFI